MSNQKVNEVTHPTHARKASIDSSGPADSNKPPVTKMTPFLLLPNLRTCLRNIELARQRQEYLTLATSALLVLLKKAALELITTTETAKSYEIYLEGEGNPYAMFRKIYTALHLQNITPPPSPALASKENPTPSPLPLISIFGSFTSTDEGESSRRLQKEGDTSFTGLDAASP